MAELDTNELLRQCAERTISAIVPTRDGELALFAELRAQAEASGVFLPISSPATIDSCLDKLEFARRCEKLGLRAIPTSERLGDVAGDRIVVKERVGSGSRSMAIGVTRRDAEAHAKSLDRPVFQPHVDGKEHSIDLYVDREGNTAGAVARLRIRVHDGEAVITETVAEPDLVAAGVALAAGLRFGGMLYPGADRG